MDTTAKARAHGGSRAAVALLLALAAALGSGGDVTRISAQGATSRMSVTNDLLTAGLQGDAAMQREFAVRAEIEGVSVTFGRSHRRPVPDQVISVRVEVETAVRFVELKLRRAPRLTILDAEQGLGTMSRTGNIVTLSSEVRTSEGQERYHATKGPAASSYLCHFRELSREFSGDHF